MRNALWLTALLAVRHWAGRAKCEAPAFEDEAVGSSLYAGASITSRAFRQWRQHISKGRAEDDLLYYHEFASAIHTDGDFWRAQEVKLLDVFRHINRNYGKSVMIDVGLQFGQEARYALDTKVAEKVYSFEIDSTTASLVRAAFPFNHYIAQGRFVLRNAGVSARSGSILANMYTDEESGMLAGGTIGNDLTLSVEERDRLTGHTSTKVEVEMVSLDDMYAEKGLQFAELIKIDTDGHEMGVFRGMNSTLSDHKAFAILWEYSFAWGDSGHVLADGIELFQKSGYRSFALGHTQMLELDATTARNNVGKLPFSVLDMVSVLDESPQKEELVRAYNGNVCNSVVKSSVGAPERATSDNQQSTCMGCKFGTRETLCEVPAPALPNANCFEIKINGRCQTTKELRFKVSGARQDLSFSVKLSALLISATNKEKKEQEHHEYSLGSQYDELASSTFKVATGAAGEDGCHTVTWRLKQAVCFSYAQVCMLGVPDHSAMSHIAWNVLPDLAARDVAGLVATEREKCAAAADVRGAAGPDAAGDTM